MLPDELRAEPDDDSVPIPPRFWWLKRILIASGILIVALVALRLWWGWYASRQLQAEIDRIVAAGEPIYPEDFNPKEDIPDEENAAFYYKAAAKKLSLTTKESELVGEIRLGNELTKKQANSLRKIVEGNTEVLSLTEIAKKCVKVDWGVRYRSPASTILPNHYGDQRTLAKFLASTAAFSHREGEYADSIKRISLLVEQGDDLCEEPTLIANLVGIAIVAIATNEIESLAPSLSIYAGQNDSTPFATREQVKELIDALLRPRPQKSLSGAMSGSRMFYYDLYRTTFQEVPGVKAGLFSAGWFGELVGWPLLPLYTCDHLWALNVLSALMQAASAETLQTATKLLPEGVDRSSFWEGVKHPISRISGPSEQRSLVLHFRHLAIRRMAAVALAIRLYELDHGHRPPSLVELVPEYLREIPDDPFALPGTKFQYLPAATPPIIYCVGQDGNDDGGKYRGAGYFDGDKLDFPFFLNGDRPRPPSTKKDDDSDDTAEDQGNVKDQEGKDNDGEAEKKEP